MRKIALTGIALGLLGCQLPNQNQAGHMALRLLWPQFSIQVIPAATETLELKVTSKGNIDIEEIFSRTASELSRNYSLPIGQKQIEVLARDQAGVVLASSRTEVLIRANQTARAEIELQPVPTPSPTTSASAPPANTTGGSGNNTPSPQVSAAPGDANAPSAGEDSVSSPTPVSSASPAASATPNTGGSSGGSSGGGRIFWRQQYLYCARSEWPER